MIRFAAFLLVAMTVFVVALAIGVRLLTGGPGTDVTVAPGRPAAVSAGQNANADVAVSRAELQTQVEQAASQGRLPLQDPSVSLAPPDRVLLRGKHAVFGFTVPLEIELQLLAQDGKLRVRTTRIEAAGADVPGDMRDDLARRIDAEAERTIAAAIPDGVAIRQVSVSDQRIALGLGRAAR